MIRRFVFVVISILLARCVTADVLVLHSGKSLKIQGYSVEGQSMRITLNERGEMVIPLDWVREIRATPPEPESDSVAGRHDFAYSDLVMSLSRKHALDWKLVAAVMAAESNFDAEAVSPRGAQGLMQLMPETSRLYSVRDPFDPIENVDAGVRHLKWLLQRYGGKLNLALAAYNAGEKVVDRYGGIPPYDETREYVKRVLRFYRNFSI